MLRAKAAGRVLTGEVLSSLGAAHFEAGRVQLGSLSILPLFIHKRVLCTARQRGIIRNTASAALAEPAG